MPGSDWGCGRANLLGASSRVKVCAVLRSSGGSEGVFGRILRVCVCVGGGCLAPISYRLDREGKRVTSV